MNDIVTRLRACWCHDAFRDRGRVDPVCDHDGLRSEAADEIERLAAQVRRWKEIANNLVIGGEHQLDMLTGGAHKKDIHPLWLFAWEDYDREMRDE